jgi:hypothetical protein
MRRLSPLRTGFQAVLLLMLVLGMGRVYRIPADEAQAIQIARQAVAANERWVDRATFKAKRAGDGWIVMVWRAEGPTIMGRPLTAFGEPLLVVPGGDRMIMIDKNGKVVEYVRGL